MMRREPHVEFQKALDWYEMNEGSVRPYLTALSSDLLPCARSLWMDVDHAPDLLFPFREVELVCAHTSEPQFIDALWTRVRRACVRPHIPFRSESSILTVDELAADIIEKRRDPYDDDPHLVVRTFYSWLARQMNGVVMERHTFSRLLEVFGKDAVRWGSVRDESDDVDLYVHDLPVSVKNGSAFSERTFRRYRARSSRPVLYVNERLDCAIPAAPAFIIRDDESISDVIDELRERKITRRPRIPALT